MSSPHRKESLKSTAKIIERIKLDVPIWKKEFFEGETLPRWKEEQEIS